MAIAGGSPGFAPPNYDAPGRAGDRSRPATPRRPATTPTRPAAPPADPGPTDNDYWAFGQQWALGQARAANAGDSASYGFQNARDLANFAVNGQIRDINLRQNQYNVDQYRIAQDAAARQRGVLNDLYNLNTQRTGIDRMGIGIDDRANQRQYGLINAQRGDVNADWRRLQQQLTGDWGRLQAQIGRQTQQDRETEQKNRLDTATAAIGQGMVGSRAQGDIVFGRNTLGRQLADNAAARAAGLQRFQLQTAAGRQQWQAALRDLGERTAATTDTRDRNRLRFADNTLVQRTNRRQLTEDLAAAEDRRRTAYLDQLMGQLAGNEIALGAQTDYNNLLGDVNSRNAQIYSLEAQALRDSMMNAPYYAQLARTANGRTDAGIPAPAPARPRGRSESGRPAPASPPPRPRGRGRREWAPGGPGSNLDEFGPSWQ